MWTLQLISFIFATNVAISSAASIADPTYLVLFPGPTVDDQHAYGYNELDLLMQDPAFNASRTMAIYVHGFTQNLNVPHFRELAAAYLARGEQNLVAYDWSILAQGDLYSVGIPNTIALGEAMGAVLLDAVQKGLAVEKLHLVGHSLGGQMNGVIARTVSALSENAVKLHRVTGLDPAIDGFFPPRQLGQYLSASDATFVDIVHCDAGHIGQLIGTGTADFWPNNGTRFQPGCPPGTFPTYSAEESCSHVRCLQIYTETVLTPDPAFSAISADSWDDFVAGNVDASNVATMGIDCPTTASGNYYLRTGADEPYALGPDGLHAN